MTKEHFGRVKAIVSDAICEAVSGRGVISEAELNSLANESADRILALEEGDMKSAIQKMVEFVKKLHDEVGDSQELDYVLKKARRLAREEAKEKHKNLPQRQDSTRDQLRDVMKAANRMGCYDAADVIRNIVEAKEKPSAPASLVEEWVELRKVSEIFLSNDYKDNAHKHIAFYQLPRYRPSKTEDIVGELKGIMEKERNGFYANRMELATKINAAIRKYEGEK